MARLKLKRIASDERGKLIETNQGGKVLGVGQSSKFNIYDPKQQQVLKGIYQSEDFQIRNATGNPDVNPDLTTDINVQGPIGDYISLVQGRNFAIAIKAETLSGIGNWNYLTSAYELEPELIPIYDENNGTFDQAYFDNLSSPRVLLSALPYAYVSEIPLDQVYYDFDEGVMYADSISLKNPYDHKYDVDISITPTRYQPSTILSGSLSLASTSDNFGRSVSVWGNRIAIGASQEDPNAISNAGVVYVYELSGDTWFETQIISGSLASSSDNFGTTVSLRGDRLLVGAINEDPSGLSNAGVTYVYDYTGSSFIETQILSGTTLSASAGFGFSISQQDSRIAIGAYLDDNAVGFGTGSTYIFELTGGSWTETQKLTASDANSLDLFGYSVSLDDDRILIGAQRSDPDTIVNDSGAAYVFELSAGTWVETHKLRANETEGTTTSDWFGTSVILSGDTAFIGAPNEGPSSPGAVYQFVYNGSSWDVSSKLTGSLRDNTKSQYFGNAMSLYDDRLVIGAYGDDLSGALPDGSGVAYVFQESSGIWSEIQYLSSQLFPTEDDNYFSRLGVSLYDQHLVIGERQADPLGSSDDNGIANIFIFQDDLEINQLSNTREYQKIGTDKFDAWLSYTAKNNWESITVLSAQNELIDDLDQISDSSDPFHSYEQIERIKGFNRRGIQSRHKSNIFSIRIRNTNLNNAIEDPVLRRDIQSAIDTAIREVIKKITPANTQLWKVEFTGN